MAPPTAPAPSPRPADPFLAARRLARAGFDAEARTALVAAAKQHPHHPIPAELQSLAGGWQSWWRSSGVLLAVAGSLVLLAAAMRFVRPRLVIGDVDASGMDNSPGAGFSAIMQHELKQLTRGSAHRGAASRAVQLVKGPVEAIAIPATIESALPAGVSWAGALLSLLPRIVQRPLFSASVCLHRPGEQGAGVTLLLTRGSHLAASQTLWEREFRNEGPPAAGEALDPRWLAETAAVWLLFQVAAHRRRFRGRDGELVMLGTRDWRSYALFRTGVRYEEDGRGREAERLYRRALQRDSANRAARINLGSLLSDRGENGAGIDELEQALSECEGTRDPVLYSALYRLAAARYHAGAYAEALAPATQLVETIGAELGVQPRRLDPDWDAYLRSIEPSSRLLYLGVAARNATTAEALGELVAQTDAQPQRSDSAATHYNCACTYWIMARHPCADPLLGSRCAGSALVHLARAFSLRPSLAGRADQDPVLASLFTETEGEAGPAARELVARSTPVPQPA